MHILKASVCYRLCDKLLEQIAKSMKASVCFYLLCLFYGGLLQIFRESLFGKLWIRLDKWIKQQPENSFFLRRFLHEAKVDSEKSFVGQACQGVSGIFSSIYHASGLMQFFGSRLWMHPAFWAVTTVFLTPFVPTMIALALVLFTSFALLLNKASKRQAFLINSSLNKPLLFFALLYILSTIVSMGRGGSVQITAIILAFTLFALVLISAITTRKQLDYLFFFFLLAGVLIAFLGLVQYLFGDLLVESSWVDDEMFDISRRVYATFENPNILGAYFLLVIPFALAAFFAAKERMLKLCALFALAVMGLVLGLTFSRGAYLGIVFAFAVFFVLLDRRMIFLGIFALVVAYFVLPDAMLERFLSIGNMADTSTSYRVSIWLGTIDIIRDHLILGIGPGLSTWQLIYPLYAHAAAVAHHSHMLFLQVLTELGLVGFFLFLLVIYHFYKNSFIAFIRATQTTKYWAMASMAAMTAFIVMGFTDYALFNYRLRLLFWVLVAIGVLVWKLAEIEEVSA